MDESDELDKNIIYELRFTIEELRQIIIGCEQRKSWLVSGFNGKNEIANCQIKLFDSILERIEEAVRDQSF